MIVFDRSMPMLMLLVAMYVGKAGDGPGCAPAPGQLVDASLLWVCGYFGCDVPVQRHVAFHRPTRMGPRPRHL